MHGCWTSAAVLMMAGCAVEPLATRSHAIIGGDQSQANAYRATGALTATGRLRCTATLIAPDVVLTAAHCLDDPPFGYLGFTLDADLTDGVGGIVKALIAHRHPDFHEDGDDLRDLSDRNDIGVVILEHPILDVAIEPFDLEAEVTSGSSLALCGYGRTEWTDVTAGVKSDAVVLVDRMAKLELSTVSEDPQPCRGDSGGPLFAETPEGHVLTGLVSRAYGMSNHCDTGSIITRVAPYAAWIAKASQDRDAGCSAGRGGGLWLVPLALLGLLGLGRRRR
jgi:MYXO-CTERM domain-containing protein